MNNLIGKLAILFAGLIVAGVFLNLFMLGGVFLLYPVLRLFDIKSQSVGSMLYWVCLVAGVVLAFLIMRPAWIAMDKPPKRTTPPEPPQS